jgi:hypothetical protein
MTVPPFATRQALVQHGLMDATWVISSSGRRLLRQFSDGGGSLPTVLPMERDPRRRRPDPRRARTIATRRRWAVRRDPSMEEGSAMKAFRTAARMIERKVDEYVRTGGGDDYQAVRAALAKQINRLDDRTNQPEIRGSDAAREEAWATVSRIRGKLRDGEDAAYRARVEGRHADIAGLKERERERIRNMSPSEYETYRYQQEIKARRSR